MADFKPRPKKPSLLRRDEHNQIVDPMEAKRIADELTAKLLLEQRLHEKDLSFNVARGKKRDVAVHLAVTVLPSVDGHNVIGEVEREYNQWCFVLKANQLPARNAVATRAFAELAQAGRRALMRLGMVTEK